jgi:MFS superfamily sulfate permease-like transporter
MYALLVGVASITMGILKLGVAAKSIPKSVSNVDKNEEKQHPPCARIRYFGAGIQVMMGFKWGAAFAIFCGQLPECVFG